jgi:hypothetical protein
VSAPQYTFAVGDDVCWVDDRQPRRLEVHDAYVDKVRNGSVSSFLVDSILVYRTFHHSEAWGPEHMAGRFTLVPRHVGHALRDGYIPRKERA